jgi:hypothetical protein
MQIAIAQLIKSGKNNYRQVRLMSKTIGICEFLSNEAICAGLQRLLKGLCLMKILHYD